MMDSWNDFSPDPDLRELSRIASDAKDARADSETPIDDLDELTDLDEYALNCLDFDDELMGARGQTSMRSL